MSDKISVKDAQAEINGLLVAEICRDFGINFRDVYPEHILARGVGPEQAFIGLAIKRGHLALPAMQPDAAAIRKTAWNIAVEMELDAAMSTKTAAKAGAIEAAIRALIDNPGKEVMPDDQTSNSTHTRPDIGPGDQAVAGAAKFALDRIREWESDNLTDGTERDWHGHVGPALARLASTLVAQPKPVAGAAPRRASGPIDPDAGFATTGAEARWIGDVDAGVYDDTPEEIGILQARLEDQDRTIADLTRQLQGQPRRQSDVVAGAARYRTKPVVKEAIQWTGENLAEVLTFTGKHPKWDEWFSSFEHYEAHVRNDRQVFKIKTLEGTMEASPGDWIIRGLTVGQCYPCKPDIFAATYELVAGAAPVSVGPTLPRCECGMTGPCAWAECKSPNLAQKGGA